MRSALFLIAAATVAVTKGSTDLYPRITRTLPGFPCTNHREGGTICTKQITIASFVANIPRGGSWEDDYNNYPDDQGGYQDDPYGSQNQYNDDYYGDSRDDMYDRGYDDRGASVSC